MKRLEGNGDWERSERRKWRRAGEREQEMRATKPRRGRRARRAWNVDAAANYLPFSMRTVYERQATNCHTHTIHFLMLETKKQKRGIYSRN